MGVHGFLHPDCQARNWKQRYASAFVLCKPNEVFQFAISLFLNLDFFSRKSEFCWIITIFYLLKTLLKVLITLWRISGENNYVNIMSFFCYDKYCFDNWNLLSFKGFWESQQFERFLHRTTFSDEIEIYAFEIAQNWCKITICYNCKFVIDFFSLLCYSNQAVKAPASIAQSVEQLIRNQQVVCSSHITSSIPNRPQSGIRTGVCRCLFGFVLLLLSDWISRNIEGAVTS